MPKEIKKGWAVVGKKFMGVIVGDGHTAYAVFHSKTEADALRVHLEDDVAFKDLRIAKVKVIEIK